ncbi:MAG: phosphotransferase, partial [Chloroflexi bacterium]|nr:phosphotransferase [Chloroflexota bacterium]
EQAAAKRRDQRYPTCEAFLTDLVRCLGDPASATDLSPTPSPPAGVSPRGPTIRLAGDIHLTHEEKEVLRAMFSAFSQVAVQAEFGPGLSGSRVLRVHPVDASGKAHLPAVVKIAPTGLIEQEWQAYQAYVENTLPSIARLESPPTLPSGSLSGGLRYTLVGGGTFVVQSLRDYYDQADATHLLRTLNDRLFLIMGQNWWWDNRVNRVFQMRADYDSLLPVNLVISPTSSPAVGDPRLVEPDNLPLSSTAAGEHVLLKDFVITEVDRTRRQLTLNLPPTLTGPPSVSYRLRLEDVLAIDRYRVGNLVDSLHGLVKATRRDLLVAQAGQAMGQAVDLSAERLVLPGGLTLPNPLSAYQNMLDAFLMVKISTIHGDLNLENILVDPMTSEINLIDFATVRQGHALHDLLRLETEVVTKLIPAALARANLLPEAIHPFYEQLHAAMAYPNRFVSPKLPHPDLAKPFAMLIAIRRMAGKCLFNSDNWTEYYQGLTLYLLGALKFKNLDKIPKARQVAFWAAATLVDLLARPASPPDLAARPKAGKSLSSVIKIVGVMATSMLVAGLLWISGNETPGESGAGVEATAQGRASPITASESIRSEITDTSAANTPFAKQGDPLAEAAFPQTTDTATPKPATNTPVPPLTDTPSPTFTATPLATPTPARTSTPTLTLRPTDTPSQPPPTNPPSTLVTTAPPTSSPTPLPPTEPLLPAPTLLGPEDGATFAGDQAQITLSWSAVKPTLAADELYLIVIHFHSQGQIWTDYGWTQQPGQERLPVEAAKVVNLHPQIHLHDDNLKLR